MASLKMSSCETTEVEKAQLEGVAFGLGQSQLSVQTDRKTHSEQLCREGLKGSHG